jgi:predicted metal-dependent hydrolase
MSDGDRHQAPPSGAGSPEYLRAIELFNAGEYFAAHEAFESLWRGSTGTERLFYHGLTQAAVALHHLRRGNLRGARAVAERARTRLAGVPSPFRALDTVDFVEQLRRFIEDPEQAPVPRIRLAVPEPTERT